MWMRSFKPLSFCSNELSFYHRDIIETFTKLMSFKPGIFFNYHNDVIFTWIIYTSNISIGNRAIYLILKSLKLGLVNLVAPEKQRSNTE